MINLNDCKPGDKLKSKHGLILTYVGRKGPHPFPHEVEYPDGGYGSRTNEGFVWSNPKCRNDYDHDIVEILP